MFVDKLSIRLFDTADGNHCRTNAKIVQLMSEDKRNNINHNMQNLEQASDLNNFIKKFNAVVKSTFKSTFDLRDAQRVAIKSLLANSGDKNRLMAQVSTGEGKSLIVAAIAIYNAKENDRKVDIITSNSVLAKRDSMESNAMVKIYQKFNVSVANNCSSSEEERKTAYSQNVVYGTLSDFQRDHLLDMFYGRKIKGERPCDIVIVDEVDW
jgi:preprotein translocase subunit SecA